MCLITGCANHLGQVERIEEQTQGQPIAMRPLIEALEGPLRGPRGAVQLARIEVIEEQTERRVVSHSEVTPWSAWRELYEVPAGALFAPVAAVCAASALLPGTQSARATALASWGGAALNPALNTESRARVESRRGPVLASQVERSTRERRVPLADAEASLRVDDGAPRRLRSDALGRVPFHLLEIVDPASRSAPQRLVVEVGREASTEFPIAADLARRLGEARGPLRVLRSRAPDGRSLARAVFELDRLGFVDYALGLEDEIGVGLRRDPARLAEFSRELGRLFGAPVAALPAVGQEHRD